MTKYIIDLGLNHFEETERLDTCAKYFETLINKVNFKKFFFGHMHDEWKFEKYQMLYYKIIKLED